MGRKEMTDLIQGVPVPAHSAGYGMVQSECVLYRSDSLEPANSNDDLDPPQAPFLCLLGLQV